MSNQKKRTEDDGVVTSAPASKVGSLLTDLLNDAKAGVAQEQKKIEVAVDDKARGVREARDREEARKREEAQQKLIEEARRRNEALSKRERGEIERKALQTAPHIRAFEEAPATAKAPDAALAKPVEKAASKLMLAALVLIGVGLGLGGALALSPSPKDAGIDIASAAKVVVAATRKQATAEGKVLMDLEGAKNQIADLQRQVGEGQAATKNLEKEIAKLREDLKTSQALSDASKAAAGEPKGTPRHGGSSTPGSGVPGINGSVFGKPR